MLARIIWLNKYLIHIVPQDLGGHIYYGYREVDINFTLYVFGIVFLNTRWEIREIIHKFLVFIFYKQIFCLPFPSPLYSKDLSHLGLGCQLFAITKKNDCHIWLLLLPGCAGAQRVVVNCHPDLLHVPWRHKHTLIYGPLNALLSHLCISELLQADRKSVV